MEALTLNRLAKMAYEASVSKGWYEGRSRSDEEIAQLINSEIVEATEEVRNNRPLVYIINKGDGSICPLEHYGFESCEYRDGDKPVFYMKPEGELVEQADGLIRIGDYFGSKGFDLMQSIQSIGVVQNLEGLSLSQAGEACAEFIGDNYKDLTPLACHLKIISAVSDVDRGLSARRAFANAAAGILAYCAVMKFNLEGAVKLKMQYNATRAHRHGGKAL